MNDGSECQTGCACPVAMGQSEVEAAAERGGEQGPSAEELELQRLRNRVRELEEQVAEIPEMEQNLATQDAINESLMSILRDYPSKPRRTYVDEKGCLLSEDCAVLAEREACAKLVEGLEGRLQVGSGFAVMTLAQVAAAIRARGGA